MEDEDVNFTHYKFEMHDGLPPVGEPGQFFGFTKDGWGYLLRWNPARGCWVAIGYEALPNKPQGSAQFTPNIVLCKDDKADFIVQWATAPYAWPVEVAA